MSFKGMVSSLLERAIPTFGESCEYRPASGGRYFVQAVFDDEFSQIDPQTQTVVSGNLPRIGVNLKDMPRHPDKGDQVYISGETFEVYDIREDGQGGATLYIRKLEQDRSYVRST
jgi:hypothetical protein